MQQLLPLEPQQPAQRVVRIEKNLNSIGFFSPTASKGSRPAEKVVSFTRQLPGGVKTEAKATIMGTSRGLPNTADLDKYLAFQCIVADLKKTEGIVKNPIGFTTYQLLRVLGLKPTGKRYGEVDQWLDRMAGTLIKSEGAVYFARTKRYMKDRFHVFEKVYTVGQTLPDGRRAEQNYVFLSDWQLDNLNHGYVLPITLEHYQRLRSDIAKNLVPMFYIWFYATKRPIQKRYRDLCQHLNVKTWPQFSRAKEQFSPALTELQSVGYLAEWELCSTVDGTDFKLIFTAGPIFRDERSGYVRQRDDTGILDETFDTCVKALAQRGVTEKVARRLLFGISDMLGVQEQIEWIDSIVQRNTRAFHNAAGMYVSFIRDGIAPPASFVSSRRRTAIEAAELERRSREDVLAGQRAELENRYAEYRESQVASFLEGLSADSLEKLTTDARKLARKHINDFEGLTNSQRDDLVDRFRFNIVVNEIPLLSKEEFCNREHLEQLTLSSSEGR